MLRVCYQTFKKVVPHIETGQLDGELSVEALTENSYVLLYCDAKIESHFGLSKLKLARLNKI